MAARLFRRLHVSPDYLGPSSVTPFLPDWMGTRAPGTDGANVVPPRGLVVSPCTEQAHGRLVTSVRTPVATSTVRERNQRACQTSTRRVAVSRVLPRNSNSTSQGPEEESGTKRCVRAVFTATPGWPTDSLRVIVNFVPPCIQGPAQSDVQEALLSPAGDPSILSGRATNVLAAGWTPRRR